MPYAHNIPLNSKIQWHEKISPINIFGIKNLAIDFLKLILSFCLIFNLSFTANPALSTGRIAMVVMLAIYGKATFTLIVKFAKNFKLSISFFILPLPLALVWYAVNGAIDAVMISRVVWFLIYSIIGSFLYMKMYGMNLILTTWENITTCI